MNRRKSLAVWISSNPDERLFGAGCFESKNISSLGELCQVMLNNIMAMSEDKFSIRHFPNNHVSLVVGNAYPLEKGWEFYTPGTDAPDQDGSLGGIYESAINQYNWFCPWDAENPDLNRFILCGIRFLGMPDSGHMTDVGKVVSLTTGECDCQFRTAR
ncbi:hypothetical protein [Lentzea aerocolonigenes]|uniref:hypothetical protein n=1 Tax=Lentzea aerocolonigenes TaxID=68170 RepID=UPI0004C39130|nr:hypothetical protein [Lentzea aerocolonigenes]MCP2248165.1 hypothetical protein [Lentzea aerocolonigenes]